MHPRPDPPAAASAPVPAVQAWALAVDSLGTPSLFDAVCDALRATVPLDDFAALQLFKDQRPRVLLSRPAVGADTWDAYTAGPYLFDPIYRHYVGGAPAGVYRLQDIAPPDFVQSDFYVNFIANHDLRDELDLLAPTTRGWAFLLMLQRRRDRPPFSAAEQAELQRVEPLATALLRQHAALSAGVLERDRARDVVQGRIDTTLRRFGSALLTAREHAVLKYVLYGYPSALIGERLGIAEGTVKIHRRNIHLKLDITTQAELLALFVQCIPFADPELGADPLLAYQAQRTSTA